MKLNTTIFSILFSTLLFGCDSSSDSAATSTASPEQQTEKTKAEVNGVIPEYQLQALKKAKDVKQQILETRAKQKEALEKQGIN